MPRTSKQIIIAIVFLLILTGVAVGAYSIFKPDYSEPLPEDTTIKNIEVAAVSYTIPEVGKLDAIAKIKNPNDHYGISMFDYKFIVLDTNRNIIITKTGRDYVSAGQSKYIIDIGLETKSQNPATVDFEITSVDWKENKGISDPKLVIKEKVFQYSNKKGVEASVTGILVNESNYDFDKVAIKAVLYDAKDNIIGVGKTEIQTVVSKEKRSFEIEWNKLFDTSIARVEAEANTNILNSDNILKIKGNDAEKFLQPN